MRENRTSWAGTRHVQSLQKDSEADQYVVQNLTSSGVYLRSTVSNTLLSYYQPENKGGYMYEDGCDSSRIRFLWYVTKITLR